MLQKALQFPKLDRRRRVLAGVFADDPLEVRLENALAAEQRVGSIGRGFQTKPFNQLVVRQLGSVAENRVDQADAEHIPNIRAARLLLRGVLAVRLHATERFGQNSAGPFEAEFIGGSGWLGDFVFEIIQRQWGGFDVGAAQAVEHEIAQAGFEKIAEAAALLVGLFQPAFLEHFVLGKILEDDLGFVLQRREGGQQKDLERLPIDADKPVKRNLLRLGRLG